MIYHIRIIFQNTPHNVLMLLLQNTVVKLLMQRALFCIQTWLLKAQFLKTEAYGFALNEQNNEGNAYIMMQPGR